MSRITKAITYNIAERGRLHTGQDRSNVDIISMVNAINSKSVQELVKNGDLYGFYGHEIRQMYGLNPPDTVFDDTGREINIAPAIRTVELLADKNGNVTHRQEFLENDKGEYAYQQYKARIGGFSSVVKFANGFGKTRKINDFFGFDYVRNPNYATNTSYGMFDGLVLDDNAVMGLDSTQNSLTHQALKNAIIMQYDSIAMQAQALGLVEFYQKETVEAQNELSRMAHRQAKKEQRLQKRQQEIYDSLICPSVPFDEYLKTLSDFENMALDSVSLEPKKAPQQTFNPNAGVSFFDRLLGR